MPAWSEVLVGDEHDALEQVYRLLMGCHHSAIRAGDHELAQDAERLALGARGVRERWPERGQPYRVRPSRPLLRDE